MKTIAIPAQSKSVENLLKRAERDGVILKSSKGRRFVLAPIDNWIGFDVGTSDDFAEEAKATVKNKKLMKHLAARRNGENRIPLSEVKKQLRLR